MTDPYTDDMDQDATYWAPGSPDEYGLIALAAPVAITCRWQNKAELFLDAQGNQAISSAVVYPDQALELQGWLFEGTSAEADARDVAGAREIRAVGTSPDLDNDEVLNKAWL